MAEDPLTASLESVRRLAVAKQHLAGRRPRRATAEHVIAVLRDIAYVQWDPVAIVAPSHLLALRCRVGEFRPALLERLLWVEKRVFEHWTPAASLVLTEDYPLLASFMERYPESLSDSWGAQRARARKFLRDHAELRSRILTELRAGPRTLARFEAHSQTRRNEGEWTFGSDVAQMLYHLSMRGEVMVVGREGNQNVWGRTDGFLPSRGPREPWAPARAEAEAAVRALRALGTATPTELNQHFLRGRLLDLKGTLARLEAEATIHRVRVPELGARDERYVHTRDLPLLDAVEGPGWQPRLSLLPPFDNLLYSTARAQRLFDFEYVREQFLPPERRRFGTYVLPILWGERLIGRIDPQLDRARATLEVHAVHQERGAPSAPEVSAAIGASIADLARFVGARTVRYTARVPPAWRRALHGTVPVGPARGAETERTPS